MTQIRNLQSAIRQFLDGLLSPGALLVYAVLLALPFAVGHLLGLREYTSVLCGTLPAVGLAGDVQALLGLGYAAAFMVVTLLAPILALGAGVRLVLSKFGGKSD